jgi:predicted DNA-binding transcriptional regulator YafY
MPSNKNASFRHLVLNACFTTPGRSHWTMEALVERVSEKLREAGLAKSISKRMIATDLAYLRTHRAAPIEIKAGSYFYADSGFDLEKTPLQPSEIKALQEAFALLRQFPNLPHLDALAALLLKVNRDPQQAFLSAQTIQFETNVQVAGLHWLSPLHVAITHQQVVTVQYQAFHAPVQTIIFHPYLLKEWRNRWYVVGRQQDHPKPWNLALDRISALHASQRPFLPNDLFDPLTYYDQVIGVTVNDRPMQEIVFRCHPRISGYLITKPLHSSQRLIESTATHEVFSIQVIPNQEARGELFRFGPDLEVLTAVEWR